MQSDWAANRDCVRGLDHLVRRVNLPDEFEQDKRDYVARAFLASAGFFESRISVKFLRHPWWNVIAIVHNDGRIYGSSIDCNWNESKLKRELQNYLENGMVDGDLSRRIDYAAKTHPRKLPNEHAMSFRWLGTGTVGIAKNYVLANTYPTMGERDCGDYRIVEAGIKNSTGSKEFNELFHAFQEGKVADLVL